MADLPFHHPEARRKRAEACAAEADALMEWFGRELERHSPGATAETEPQPRRGVVYFIGPEGGPIKIGFASRLEFRLKELRTMNPYPLIVHGSVAGTERDERAYHKLFAAYRLHGEWFEPHPDILAEIERLRTVPNHTRPPVRVQHDGG